MISQCSILVPGADATPQQTHPRLQNNVWGAFFQDFLPCTSHTGLGRPLRAGTDRPYRHRHPPCPPSAGPPAPRSPQQGQLAPRGAGARPPGLDGDPGRAGPGDRVPPRGLAGRAAPMAAAEVKGRGEARSGRMAEGSRPRPLPAFWLGKRTPFRPAPLLTYCCSIGPIGKEGLWLDKNSKGEGEGLLRQQEDARACAGVAHAHSGAAGLLSRPQNLLTAAPVQERRGFIWTVAANHSCEGRGDLNIQEGRQGCAGASGRRCLRRGVGGAVSWQDLSPLMAGRDPVEPNRSPPQSSAPLLRAGFVWMAGSGGLCLWAAVARDFGRSGGVRWAGVRPTTASGDTR